MLKWHQKIALAILAVIECLYIYAWLIFELAQWSSDSLQAREASTLWPLSWLMGLTEILIPLVSIFILWAVIWAFKGRMRSLWICRFFLFVGIIYRIDGVVHPLHQIELNNIELAIYTLL